MAATMRSAQRASSGGVWHGLPEERLTERQIMAQDLQAGDLDDPARHNLLQQQLGPASQRRPRRAGPDLPTWR